ncbi:MAG: 3-hydroxyacyl-CoA dehydrogenase type-2 [Pseudonocardiales bacterium]|nr:3-hydroxyacyl-CoA dehydrogenase type-2 [Pseudonocardiales bacterium]
MDTRGSVAVVCGGASGLGHATARRLVTDGARVTIVDLPTSDGPAAARELGARFVAADVTDEDQLAAAFDEAEEDGPLRTLVHTAGRGVRIRVLDKEGRAGSLADFEAVVRLNVIGSFNGLRLAAERIAKHDPIGDERGVVILTASVAAYEGQIGQMAYSPAKAAIVGMTITAARDLASRQIRVCTIAPGMFDTPLFAKLRDDVQESLRASIPHPRRMGQPDEYAALASHIVANPYLNGETIRLDGAIRMAPR